MTREKASSEITREQVIKKMQNLESRMSASFPSFNIASLDRANVTLQDSKLQRRITLGTETFKLLRVLCETPLSRKEIAIFLQKDIVTLRNQMTRLLGKFREGGLEVYTQGKLIACLVEEGFLSYIPRV